MDIVTLKISIINDYLLLKINDKEQKKIKTYRYIDLNLDEIFDTPFLSGLWKKICSTPCYIYFLYNVSNLDLKLKMCNIYNSYINNKTLLTKLILNSEDTTLSIDILDTKLDTEIIIIIKIIIPSVRCSLVRTNSHWIQIKELELNMFNSNITAQIRLVKPNPMFKLCKIDTIDDYDKKIKSLKMPLYELKKNNIYNRSNYDIIFDLYPTQSSCYILILSEIINNHTSNSYKFKFDKDCTKCVNRIKGCELNMISKVQLCCICNIEIIRNDLDKFIGKSNYVIKIKDFPSYINDNFKKLSYLYK